MVAKVAPGMVGHYITETYQCHEKRIKLLFAVVMNCFFLLYQLVSGTVSQESEILTTKIKIKAFISSRPVTDTFESSKNKANKNNLATDPVTSHVKVLQLPIPKRRCLWRRTVKKFQRNSMDTLRGFATELRTSDRLSIHMTDLN